MGLQQLVVFHLSLYFSDKTDWNVDGLRLPLDLEGQDVCRVPLPAGTVTRLIPTLSPDFHYGGSQDGSDGVDLLEFRLELLFKDFRSDMFQIHMISNKTYQIRIKETILRGIRFSLSLQPRS